MPVFQTAHKRVGHLEDGWVLHDCEVPEEVFNACHDDLDKIEVIMGHAWNMMGLRWNTRQERYVLDDIKMTTAGATFRATCRHVLWDISIAGNMQTMGPW